MFTMQMFLFINNNRFIIINLILDIYNGQTIKKTTIVIIKTSLKIDV